MYVLFRPPNAPMMQTDESYIKTSFCVLLLLANLQTQAQILADMPLFILSTASGCGVVV